MKKGRPKLIITSYQEQYIRDNYSKIDAVKIGKDIGMSTTSVMTFVRNIGIHKNKAQDKVVIDFENGMWTEQIHRALFPQ